MSGISLLLLTLYNILYHIIYHISLLIAQLLYASPTWRGCMGLADLCHRLKPVIKRRLFYCKRALTLKQELNTADSNLFPAIL